MPSAALTRALTLLHPLPSLNKRCVSFSSLRTASVPKFTTLLLRHRPQIPRISTPSPPQALPAQSRTMKTRSSVKCLCDGCKPVRRKNRVYIIWFVYTYLYLNRPTSLVSPIPTPGFVLLAANGLRFFRLGVLHGPTQAAVKR